MTTRRIVPAPLAVLGALALGLPGCSAIVNGSNYLADGGGGGRDGATDGATDDGAVDGAVDGGTIDAGPIENLPPRVGGVGLSTYRPVLDETLQALLGPTHDPNGDSLATRVTWFLNGAEISGATGTSLTLDPSMHSVGDEISVRVVVEDPEGLSGEATAGPAIIRADDATVWRLLTPPRHPAQYSVDAFDAGNQRLLFWSRFGQDVDGGTAGADQGLWEMQLSPSDRQRWVQLHPSGSPPPLSDGAVILYDPTRERLLHFGGRVLSGGTDMVTNDLFALDLSDRGNESWTEITVGTAPSPRQIVAVALSADGTRALLHGGATDAGAADDLWEIDLATASFTDRGVSTGTPLIGSTLIWDEARNRVIRVGGTASLGDTAVPVASVGIIDLDDGSFSAADDFPTPLLGAAAVVIGDTAYVVGGLGGSTPATVGPSDKLHVIDLTDLTVTSSTISPGPETVLATLAPRAPFAPTWIYGGRGIEHGTADFFAFDLVAGSGSIVTGAGVDYPERQAQGVGRMHPGVENATFLGGRLGLEAEDPMFDQVWEYSPDGEWLEVVVGEDPAPAGGPVAPSPRWGTVYDGSHPFPNAEAFQILGGNGASLQGGAPWRIVDDGGPHWEAGRVTSAMEPSARFGFGLFSGGCGGPVGGVERGNVLGVFGGEDFSGSYVNDTWMLECDVPSGSDSHYRNCQWMNDVILDPVASPSPRRWMALALAGRAEAVRTRNVFMFGGELTTGVSNELFMFDNCASSTGPADWQPVTIPSGLTPAARMGHSMSHVRPPAGAPATAPATILMFGGADGAGDTVNDTWRLVPGDSGGGGPRAQWETIDPPGDRPPPRRFHVAVWDHVNRRLLVYGGAQNDVVFDDLWELRVRP